MTENLPLDPDIEVEERRRGTPLPLHLRPGAVLVVIAGGTVGTALREALALAIPPLGELPVAILLVNVVGAFLLGLLLDALVRRGPDEGRRRTVRLLFGTGGLGGFTTYSTFATDTAALMGSGSIGPALLYAALTLVVGALATAAGIAVATAAHRRAERAA